MMADHIASVCEFSGCPNDSVHRCATCDLWTCEEHHDHGPIGDGPHLAVGSDAARLTTLEAENAELRESLAECRGERVSRLRCPGCGRIQTTTSCSADKLCVTPGCETPEYKYGMVRTLTPPGEREE